MLTKRLLVGCISAVLFAAAFASCGDQDESSKDGKTTKAPDTTVATTEGVPASDTPIDITQGATEAMIQRSVMNAGDTTRLQAKMNQGMADSKNVMNIAFIGGSITQGSSASTSNQYTTQIINWWEENVCYVNPIKAGVGATDSYIGVHRLDNDVLSKEPDVIFVEFSVNDTNAELNKLTYDSLVRKCLNAPNKPAVVLIITTMEDGTSMQDVHAEIGKAYNLPIISYHDAVFPEVKAGSLAWTSISDDNIHPNNQGHILLGSLIDKYLDSVKTKLDTSITESPDFTTAAVTDDIYANATLGNRNSGNVTVKDEGSFTEDVSFQTFTGGWATTTGGSITFEVEAQNIGMIYLESVNGDMGIVDVLVDGKTVTSIDGAFPGGWGNYAQGQEVYRGKESAKHTVEVKVTGDVKGFQILDLLLS